jgi:hypothetical protein
VKAIRYVAYCKKNPETGARGGCSSHILQQQARISHPPEEEGHEGADNNQPLILMQNRVGHSHDCSSLTAA